MSEPRLWSGPWPSLAALTGTGGWLLGSPLSKWHSAGRILEAPSQSCRAGCWQGQSSKGVEGRGVGGQALDVGRQERLWFPWTGGALCASVLSRISSLCL